MRLSRGKIKLVPVTESRQPVSKEIVRTEADYNPIYGDFVKRKGYFEFLCDVYREKFGIVLKRMGRTAEFYKGETKEKITDNQAFKELWGESASAVSASKKEEKIQKRIIAKEKVNSMSTKVGTMRGFTVKFIYEYLKGVPSATPEDILKATESNPKFKGQLASRLWSINDYLTKLTNEGLVEVEGNVYKVKN